MNCECGCKMRKIASEKISDKLHKNRYLCPRCQAKGFATEDLYLVQRESEKEALRWTLNTLTTLSESSLRLVFETAQKLLPPS